MFLGYYYLRTSTVPREILRTSRGLAEYFVPRISPRTLLCSPFDAERFKTIT